MTNPFMITAPDPMEEMGKALQAIATLCNEYDYGPDATCEACAGSGEVAIADGTAWVQCHCTGTTVAIEDVRAILRKVGL